jgi:putative transposase
LYYEPVPESEEDLGFKRLIDEEYTRHPFYGARRIATWLTLDKEKEINIKRVRRLMREMGLEAIYPKPKLSLPGKAHRIYPYLLKGWTATAPDEVWATDITYIRLRRGFVYLVAVLDWYSRYVVSWDLSITMDAGFCVVCLEDALRRGTPEIFNSDQGSQFTSEEYTRRLIEKDIRISMDGRGRAFDNIFVERLWRTVKYEEVYLHDYETVEEAREGLKKFFHFYNEERRHQSLDKRTPSTLYHEVKNIGKVGSRM